MLTEKQRELLDFLHERTQARGVTPSFDEMRDHLKLQSKSGVHRLVVALEERGFIKRLPNRARAIEVVRSPTPGAAPRTLPFAPIMAAQGMRAVPMMGRIAAGTPISAIQTHTHDVMVAGDLLAAGDYFALEVRGDSMINAGILDGDTVLIRKEAEASTGEIVVALVDDEEATLKRFRRRGRSIALEPANPAYETRLLGSDRVKVQGVLAGLVRRY